MNEKQSMSRSMVNFLYQSIYPPLFLLAVFGLFILAQFVKLPPFLHLSNYVLLANNICFLLLICLRFIHFLTRRNRDIRYGADNCPKTSALLPGTAVEPVRQRLAVAGFRFEGNYGEKRSLAFFAMMLLYGGLFTALLVGTYENLRQFSCVTFHNTGAPAPLDDPQQYLRAIVGPLASLKGMPNLQIGQMILPNSQWPKGAVEVSLLDKKGAVLTKGTLASQGQTLECNGIEYTFTRFLYDFILEIGTRNNYIEFSDSVKFQPLVAPIGGYTHSVKFNGERLKWNALLDPSRMALKLAGGKEKKLVEGEVVFRKEPVTYIGDYDVKIAGMSQWAEIHIVRKRHMYLIYFGGAIALIGLLMRLMFHPQRVWLESTPDGARVWAVGGETKKLVKS